MAGVLVENAVDMLRFLAIGYCEPAFPECHDLTLEEEVDEYVPRFVPPTAFRDWVSTTFDVTIPARATEVVRSTASIGDVSSGDLFLIWLEEMQDRFG